MAYCALFTLLLAFFICLQTFGRQQGPATYRAGMGALLGGPESFGGGGVFDTGGAATVHGQTGPRYKASEGQEEPPAMRRIDPELEEAQQAMEALEKQFGVREPKDTVGYRVQLSTPCTYSAGKVELTPEEDMFLEGLAVPLEQVVLARGFVVRLAVGLQPREAGDVDRLRIALAAAERVRSKLIASMSATGRRVAGRRMYCFLRTGGPEAGVAASEAGQLMVDILLTKPYVRQMTGEGAGTGESQRTG